MKLLKKDEVNNNLKRILITGGTGKIGSCLAEGFAASGWQVIITSRNQARADQLAELLQKRTGAVVKGIAVDLSENLNVQLFVDSLKEANLLPHCLINNARDLENLRLGQTLQPSSKKWQREFQLSVVAAYELSMQLAEKPDTILENVINVSSMYGVVAATPYLYDDPASQSPIHYGVCKAALIHLTKELAVRLAHQGVRVNAISYGGVEGRADTEFIKRYARLSPQGRMLNDEDIAGPALFLASDASAVTGHNLIVDGGWSIW